MSTRARSAAYRTRPPSASRTRIRVAPGDRVPRAGETAILQTAMPGYVSVATIHTVLGMRRDPATGGLEMDTIASLRLARADEIESEATR